MPPKLDPSQIVDVFVRVTGDRVRFSTLFSLSWNRGFAVLRSTFEWFLIRLVMFSEVCVGVSRFSIFPRVFFIGDFVYDK